MISEDGVSPLPSKIEAIKQIPVPKTVKEVRSFLGLSGYYRRFIKNYATISAPLTKLTTKTCTTQFNWTADCENAFTLLKTCLCKSPVLVHPKFDREFLLQTDASDIGLGAILSQLDDNGVERPRLKNLVWSRAQVLHHGKRSVCGYIRYSHLSNLFTWPAFQSNNGP